MFYQRLMTSTLAQDINEKTFTPMSLLATANPKYKERFDSGLNSSQFPKKKIVLMKTVL